MPLVETLTTAVGGSIAKSLLKVWLGDADLAQATGASLSDLAEGKAKGLLEKRRLERTFERMAEEIARKLAFFLEAEFPHVPANERNAAILAAQDTIDSAQLTPDLLVANDLEPIRLEKALRGERVSIEKKRLLSLGGGELYDFLMREAANYIVEIATTLPPYKARATREILERETALIELVEEVLRQLPSGQATIGDPEGFEVRYRREVARKLDRLELFGLSTNPLNRRYALSVAYIALTASARIEPDQSSQKTDEQEDRSEFSIEELAARGSRLLVRGEAGSGKTTLLQWLAVSSARQRFDGDLEDWNALVPFFVQLRHYVGKEFPRPSSFPASVNPALADVMPPDWPSQRLQEGNALVLIDGVDELGEDEREPAAEWLRDLIHLYPHAKYVVTSRPPAVSESWLDGDGFKSAFLEPMDVAAIDSFIDHWHEAARGNAADDEELGELQDLASRLKTLIRTVSQIRNLATSPLLCAMLCALHRDRKAQLPRARVELYRVALEMLLERRDLAREVATEGIDLARPQKEVLLQGVAYWLLLNGFSDATKEDVRNLLKSRLDAIPRLNSSPTEVLDHLVLRSGLLREPVKGRIDFIHRTFQEYLTAKQAVDERSIGLLAEHAHEDQWQEVIILAAGLGVGSFSQDLIRHLLDQGSDRPDRRHRLQLLAVACLETTQTLPKAMQEEIAEVLRGLMPPKSMSEAKALASAGEIAVPMLAEHPKDPVATAAPAARALGLIGGQDAMAALEAFGPDRRVTVARELVRAWDYFPEEEYAKQVLQESALNRGELQINTPDKLAGVRHLKQLTALRCRSTAHNADDWDWEALQGAIALTRLDVEVYSLTRFALQRVAPPGLQSLRLAYSGLKQLDLTQLNSLRTLVLVRNEELGSLMGLDTLSNLENLHIVDAPLLSADFRFPPTLQAARLRGLSRVEEFDVLGSGDALQVLELHDIPLFRHLTIKHTLPDLKTLIISNCESLETIASALDGSGIEHLSLFEVPDLDLGPVFRSSSIEELRLHVQGVEVLPRLSLLENLRVLDLSECMDLMSLTPLAGMPELQRLSLGNCVGLCSLDSLRHIHSLTDIDLELCRGITTLEPLLELPNLKYVDVRGCSPELEVETLRDRGVSVMTGQPLGFRFVGLRPRRLMADLQEQ